MKTKVDFLNGLHASAKSENFENKVLKLLPNGVTQIYLNTCTMEWLGRGSYNYKLDLEINGSDVTLRERTTDAPSYDAYQSMEYGSREYGNWIKNTVLMLLENNTDLVIELITENVEL